MYELFIIISFVSIFMFYYKEFQVAQSIIFYIETLAYLLNDLSVKIVDDMMLKSAFILCIVLTGFMYIYEKSKGEK